MKKNLQIKLADTLSTNFFTRLTLSLIIGLFFLLNGANAQTCPLACDDEVNVSLDGSCQALITPDVMLEEAGPCSYQVVVFGPNGLPLPTPVVNGSHIGKRLKVAVYLGNNSCWGHILVEDKFRPIIVCPKNDTVFCTVRNHVPTAPIVFDNCTAGPLLVKHTLYDSMYMYDRCMDPLLNNIIGYRKFSYYYSDASGNNSDTCTQFVYFKKFLESDITWPRDTAFSCKQYNDSIPQPNESGVPSVYGDVLYPDWGFCKSAVTFEDQVIPLCPKSFKVLRTWTIIDWCMPSGQNVYKRYQIIKVIDDRGPVVFCNQMQEVSTDVNSCTGTAIVSPPNIIDECSKVSILVGYKVLSPNGSPTYEGTSNANITKLPNGNYRITGLPLGLSWVIFRMTDECGNFTDCATEVKVVDKVPPIPICDQKTIVSLTIDGTARIDAITFDDGSLDNCELDRYEVKRNDNGAPCNTPNGSLFGPSVYFCCADVGKTLMVTLRVWDKAGNSNVCMVEVMVQDKIPPVIVCPPDITVSCEFNYVDLDVFGTVVNDRDKRKEIKINDPYKTIKGEPIDGYAYDGCGTVITSLVLTNLKCGIGTIQRIFTATDPSGLFSTCIQTITIKDFTPNNIEVIPPADYVSNTTCMTSVDVDPSVTGSPIVKGEDKCTSIFMNYEDKVYTLDPDACVKIIRTWTVIDWCVYDPNAQNPRGYYTWKQVIKISNTQPPTFRMPCTDRVVDVYGPNCGGNIDLIGLAKDDCTDSINLKWTHIVDLNNDGKIDSAYSGPGNNASAWYPIGKHKITFIVEDACRNKNTCMYVMTVRDAKKPTPYCLSSITTTVMPSTKNIEIWAKDFNLNSEDNCTPKDRLRYFFLVNNTFVPSMTFDCANIGKNTVRMYVVDTSGNSDYCEAMIEIQDPNKVCGTTGLAISGRLLNTKNQKMENVSVFLERSNPAGSVINYTNNNGVFLFQPVIPNVNYTISAEKNTNHINGVSTADIVAIQKHILGKQSFSTPYQIIAADVNNSNTVTSADISEIRKLILGVNNEFSKNKSWRFIPKSFVFSDPQYPFPYSEKITYGTIIRDEMSTDFIGIKIGDVTEDNNPSGSVNTKSRTNSTVALSTQNEWLDINETKTIDVVIDEDFVMSGIQMSLKVDPKRAELINLESSIFEIPQEGYSLEDNTIKISIAPVEAIKLSKGTKLFSLKLRSLRNSKLSEVLEISNTDLPAEIYNENIETSQLELQIRNNEIPNQKPSMVQNIPNPFSEQTVVSFNLPESQMVKFDIFDLNGKLIHSLSNVYHQGKNEITIRKNMLGGPGIYSLKMSTKDFSETRKMVLIK